ncbi:MAG TPA: FtsX-like permease family protein [Solirubrobacteraceae bacterium]|jgi:putative ABC transport system permease protein|nr:FtsX-like permease family protein [Solirubrobacteraceae bacterium]
MRRVALKGLWWRRGRAVLTAFAVVLGVAMVSGTFILTDTINKAFDSIFQDSYSKTSAVISGREVVKGASSGTATVPASLLDRVRANDNVADATGAIFSLKQSGTAKLIDKHGDALGTSNNGQLGFGFDPRAERFNPLVLASGRWASGPGQVVIDKGVADDNGYAVGDRIGVAARGPTRQYTITGLANYGKENSIGGATIAVFDVPTAQALQGKRGEYDTIFVAARDGVSSEQLVRDLRPDLPATAQIRTGAEQASTDSKDSQEQSKFVQYFLLAFGFIALGVGAFVIFNTLSITLAQRIRELATLRTLGASRRQVRRSVLTEGLAMGVFASVLGLVLGIALAKGLNAVFQAFGVDLPTAATVIETRTVVVALGLGILVTLIASISPARRATRIAPVSALREGATLPPRLGARAPAIPLTLLAVAGVACVAGAVRVGTIGQSLILVGVGAFALVLGVIMIAGRLVRPLARVVGGPARSLGGPAGRLASANATRNTTRTATTAAALMIGLALVTLVATLSSSFRASTRSADEKAVSADYVVTSKSGFDTIPAAVGAAVARAPGVGSVSAVRHDEAKAFGKKVSVEGIAPTFAQTVKLRFSDGSDAVIPRLGDSGAIVKKAFADDHGLRIGSPFRVTTPAGRTIAARVAAITDPKADLLGDVLMSQAAFDRSFPRPGDLYVFVRAQDGTTPATTAAIERAVGGFPDVDARTRSAWLDFRGKDMAQFLNLLYVLLALSVVVSLFGMVNALVLSVFERTREIGMMRAVGMTRRQVRRMVRHESVITALIGAGLGLPLGLVVAAAMAGALGSPFVAPVPSLVIFTLVAIAAGILAAIAPARRASRLNVLEALHYE